MKRISVLLCMLFVACSVFSQWRTQERALEIARTQKTGSQTKKYVQSAGLEPAYVLQSKDKNHSLIYGFNYKNGGFVLVSGCEYTPEIIGYADNGSLPSETKDMPDGLRYLMEVYKEQIQYATQSMNRPPAKATPSKLFDVEPFIKTQWNQSSPYNDDCPSHYPAGCVAIAMAQVMNYYQWPDRGVGSRNGYDFSKRTWDWNKMLTQYSENVYSVETAKEVSTLVRYLGASVNMDYAPDGSGATSYEMIKSLHDYWKYDDGMSFASRDNYSDGMWEELIFNEISQHRPVLYEGHSRKPQTQKSFDLQSIIPGDEIGGGHVFILDGYKQGLFHVNWGWGGYCDGYFMINSLNPTHNPNSTEYLYNQNAFLGVQPETSESIASRLESREKWTLSGASVMDDMTLNITGFVSCYSVSPFTGKVGVIVTDLETQEQYSYLEEEINNLDFWYGRSVTVHVPTKELKSNHSYKAELVFLPSGSSEVTVLPVPIDQPTLTFKVGNAGGAKELYPRRMVVEEGTGTWCPWCVRGIVGMEYMTEN